MATQPMFPLQSALLPGESLPLRIFEPRYAQLVRDCLDMTDPAFGVVLITRGREVGGGDVRSDVGALARITEYADQGMGQYQLNAVVGERIRVLQWLSDDPYPRAVVEPWPDEPGPPVTPERIGEVIDQMLVLFEMIVSSRGARLRPDALAVEPEIAEDPALHIYELASRVPMGQADRYAVLAAPTLADRVDALTDAIETVTAMVEFQIASDGD
ncbi:LON peptidase substrate-binding domain-containing protein [Mycobacterium sp. shizuoka-1]|uniref:LON peptidase substrate-binding domain-containing protein n=1 Tax=Mycobacterium sp. shizuoka-1 TaxID=2039281 RepID=UPI000C066854|nr:LON peptidase substrate-binding domain-containing protein [Mycobacterium sp. shizuoka-1]GAY14755.1 ATP-dependent protease [Mycobacterium sp. shizuoka-1]